MLNFLIILVTRTRWIQMSFQKFCSHITDGPRTSTQTFIHISDCNFLTSFLDNKDNKCVYKTIFLFRISDLNIGTRVRLKQQQQQQQQIQIVFNITNLDGERTFEMRILMMIFLQRQKIIDCKRFRWKRFLIVV